MSLGTGGPNQFGQTKGIAESEIHKLTHRALDMGINLFDTSPGYGESERILGRALKKIPRDKYVISTKVRVDDGKAGGEAAPVEEVVRTVEESLQRLQVSEIDILLLAGWGRHHAYKQIVEHTYPAIQKLQEQGKIRFIGSSEKSAYDGSHEWLARGLRDDLFDTVMVAYNMINQSAEREIFPLCKQNNVGTQIIFSVRKLFNNPERLKQTLTELVRKNIVSNDAVSLSDPLGWVTTDCQAHGIPGLIEAAYRFSAAHEAITTVMTGTNDIGHLEQNVNAVLAGSLPPETMGRLRQTFFGVAEVIGN
jgi:L-galactose dehydrogenase